MVQQLLEIEAKCSRVLGAEPFVELLRGQGLVRLRAFLNAGRFVHLAAQRGDVEPAPRNELAHVQASSPMQSHFHLAGILDRLAEHVAGDLVKFYGIGVGRGADGAPPWFRWFHHKDQRIAGHRFDEGALARVVRRAAMALGLDVYGGDAIVTPMGDIVLLDVNAWPSFALYRDEAAERIAAHLVQRCAGGPR